jgi:hypothetical protein
MHLFIRNTGIFCLCFLVAFCILFISTNVLINKRSGFAIPHQKEYVILGHSHPAYAFNDSLIDNFWNGAQSMEGYFCIYYKTRKLLEANKQIKAIFIEYTNNQIEKHANERVWGKYLPYLMPRMSPVLDVRGQLTFLCKNPLGFAENVPYSLKKNLLFLLSGKKSFLEATWVPNDFITHVYKDTLSTQPAFIDNAVKGSPIDSSIAENNLYYLTKIIKLCSDNKIMVYLIRCPLPPSRANYNDYAFNKIKEKEFPNVPFLDFINYPLFNSDFADNEHLNYIGARKFSTFFNRLIHEGLLETPNQQKFINREMKN